MTRSKPRNSNQLLLPNPVHERNFLPVPRSGGRLLRSRLDSEAHTSIERKTTQVIQEFRSKLKVAEDLISKLAFNLREIQGTWRKSKSTKDAGSRNSQSTSDSIGFEASPTGAATAKIVDMASVLASAAEERS